MYVVEVIPFRRGVHRRAFSYFSKEPVVRGTVVTIPVRSATLQGVVTECTEVSATKAALRGAAFSLRRLPQQDDIARLPQHLLQTADALSEHYAAQPGAVLFALLPKEVRDGRISCNTPDKAHAAVAHSHEDAYEVLQAPAESRMHSYQSIIRESFARKRSVVMSVPTIEEASTLHAKLSSGIAEYVVVLHGGLGIRALRSAYQRIREEAHALLIIATPHYALYTRHDVGTIIIERSRATSYRLHTRPYLDFRHALATHARITGSRCISADTLPRSEDEYLVRMQQALPHEEHPKRIALPGTLKTIRMPTRAESDAPFTLFSDLTLSAIERTRAAGGRTFLFSARRGLAPVVACADCGTLIRCPRSGSPLSLHRTVRDGIEERWLISSVSGFRRRADDTCAVCGSWRLREHGIGIQHVYDELASHVPHTDIILLDRQSASTHRKAQTLRDAFYARRSAILLGTALALPYLNQEVDLSVVVSMESLRALPSWRGHEEALSTLLTLREKTLGYVFAQTRADDDELITHAQKGTTAAFYTEELTARERYGYPPYRVFIHLAWRPSGRDQLDELIAEQFAPYEVAIYAAPDAEDALHYALVRIPAHAWPDDTLIDIVRSLPPSVRVMIDPDRIL